MKVIDLNSAASPELVSAMLREVADRYRSDAAELALAWQDETAGRVWVEIAKALDSAADKADKACAKYFV